MSDCGSLPALVLVVARGPSLAVSAGALAGALVWFALAFGIYRHLFAAVRSWARRIDKVSGSTVWASVPMVALAFGGVMALVLSPSSRVAAFLSFFPPSAPFTMPARLTAFDSAELAEAVAACRVPVLAAIGHATERTVCDMVAHGSFPTPSAAAAALVARAEARERERAAAVVQARQVEEMAVARRRSRLAALVALIGVAVLLVLLLGCCGGAVIGEPKVDAWRRSGGVIPSPHCRLANGLS